MRYVCLLGSFAAASVWFLACGGDDNGETGSNGTGASAASGAGADGAGAGATGSGGLGFGGGDTGGSATGGSCAGRTVVAEPLPLDLYVMLDSSGSMLEKTGKMGQGVVKWDAITTALSTFFADPGSTGLGVGLQYFPLRVPGVPETCSSDASCGAYGPCLLKICDNATGIVPCTSSQQCGQGGQCVNLGQCANDTATFCLPIGAYCPGNKGQCVQVQSSFCLDEWSCNAADYATPEVEIAALPGAAAALDASISARDPAGGTPTSAALQGAIDHATAWAGAHADHKVVAVLASDGEPTACDPLDAAGIAAIAATGAPLISTFVIGVVASNDNKAIDVLNEVAAAGGTDNAFLVDPATQDVGTAFLDALNEIRGSALACEYQIPQPEGGETIDYAQVNVDHTPQGGSAGTVFYVGSEANCDPETGGWFYDVDPAAGTPTKILVCPSTCGVFKTGGTVNIRVGCATVLAPPK